MRKLIFCYLILLTSTYKLDAQFKRDRFISPKLSLGYEWIAESDYKNDSGTYKLSSTGLNYSMPLWTKNSKGGQAGSFGFYAVMLNAGAHYSWPVLSDLLVQHKLFDGQLGLSTIIYPGNKNLFLFGGNVLLKEDNLSIKNLNKLRYNGFLIWNFKFNTNFGLNTGIAYTYKFGRGLLTPLLGADFKYKDFKAKIILPLHVEAGFDLAKNLELSLVLKPDGSLNNFYNDRFATEQLGSTILFKQHRYKLGLNAKWQAISFLKINAEAGMAGKQWIAFSSNSDNSDENFTETNLRNTGYINITLTLLFGEQTHWGKAHATNYLLAKDVDEVIQMTE